MSYKPFATGIDDFKKLRSDGYYYVDKTGLIKELLEKKGEVNLFTRPRRFGKTLNLSMLKYFFEETQEEENSHLFDGLDIMNAGELYTKEMGQYPVIMLTLKSAKQGNFQMAYDSLVGDISKEYLRHSYVLDSESLIEEDKEKFKAIRGRKAEKIDYAKSLQFLSQCLETYHSKKVIILIDEYDVPLESAYYKGYYNEMIDFIRSLFESALKGNPHLEFAVITGCLRISKESIFTGLNNLKINSILSETYDEYFGFVENEVRDILKFYDRENKMETVKQWYDGYRFGDCEVYNPWSVINYMERIYEKEDAFPTIAWANTSSNNIVKDLIYHAGETEKDEIETLLNDGTIVKPVHEDITYEDIYDSPDNLWNFLFFTGYLKQVKQEMIDDVVYLTFAIPNKEVKGIFREKISGWFRDEVKGKDLTSLYQAMLNGEEEVFQKKLNEELQSTISYMDSKEAFYHGFLLGLLANLDGYKVKSNREAGDGRFDICVLNSDETKPPIILELKISDMFKKMESEAERALEQIENHQYDGELSEDGYTESIRYGIAFFKKKCRVKMERKSLV